MASHIIVGAGLGGLYLATRLINKGVKPENIIIVEKRPENHYTRPGHLNDSTFELVTRYTGIQIPHSQANHIKELERMLYRHLKRQKVRFINEEFIGLQPQTKTQVKAIITRKNDKSQVIYPADYVFDCSGKESSVTKAVNNYQQSLNLSPAFNTNLLTDINPITHHLVAHVLIAKNDALIDFFTLNGEVVPPHVKESSLQKNIELRDRLKSLGWPYEAFPTFYTYSQRSRNKICLYMETPPNLAQTDQREWIKLLLTIYSNGMVNDYTELKPSRKYGIKPRIVGFKSTPYVLNKVVHESANLPPVTVCFDALKGFDYRLAQGVISGIVCCERMLKCIDITDGDIKAIDRAAIERETFDYIHGVYQARLTGVLTSRKMAIENAYEYFSEVYEKAAITMPSLNAAKKQEYLSLAGQLAYQAVTVQYSKLETRDRGAMASLLSLEQCLGMLIRAHHLMPAIDTSEHHGVNEKLLCLITTIRLEVKAFPIEDVLTINNAKKLKVLFNGIERKFQQLDGHFATNPVLKDTRQILEIIQRLEGTNTRSLASRSSLFASLKRFNDIVRTLSVIKPEQNSSDGESEIKPLSP